MAAKERAEEQERYQIKVTSHYRLADGLDALTPGVRLKGAHMGGRWVHLRQLRPWLPLIGCVNTKACQLACREHEETDS